MLSKQEIDTAQNVESLKIIPLKRSLETITDNNDALHSTQDSEKIWNLNVLSWIQNALDQGQHDKVIEQANQALVDLKRMETQIIKFQMNAWKNKGNFVQQLKHAETIIQQSPKDAIGYINAAEVYSTRGQQVRLRDLHRDALCRISQRIDFIAQLPYDLACMIANYFQLESLDEHIKVSRTWRERLLQYPTIWRRWSIFNAFPDTDNNIHLLPKITAYIQELTVDYFEFPVLRELNISALEWNTDKHNPECLKKVGATVTKLSLRFYGTGVIPLSKVLMDCRNLIKLEYACFGIDSHHRISVPSLLYTTSLKEFHVSNGDFGIAGDTLDGLIMSSPNLRIITFLEADGAILSTIYHHCPALVLLALNAHDSMYTVDAIISRIPDEATKLQHLYLYTVSSPRYVKPFLQHHQYTLKSLELGIVPLEDDQEEVQNWKFLSTLKMPKLELVVFDMELSSSLEQYVAPMIKHSLSLETIKLANFSKHGITEHMIHVMEEFLSLDRLIINNCKFVLTDKEAVIESFEELYNLTDVEIQHCFGTTQVALEGVASLPLMMYLEIAGQNNMTMEDLRSFTKKLATTSDRLTRVTFENMTINSGVLEEFKDACYDELIWLHHIRGVNKYEAQKALSSCVSLSFTDNLY